MADVGGSGLPVVGDPVVGNEAAMAAALAMGRTARRRTSPNPWVGSVVVADGRIMGTGATQPPGGAHAERSALAQAGPASVGATLFTTLEPCDHQGRTGPCTEAILDSGVRRVVVGIEDPDPNVSSRGVARLRDAGLEVEVGVLGDEVAEDLTPYLRHRMTGRPHVVLKMAATLDGRTAAPDGTSRWITGPEARADVHSLRADSDAVVVGAGTVRADDPRLDVRDLPDGPASEGTLPDGSDVHQPRRVVLGSIPDGARVLPADEHHGEIGDLLDRLGAEGVLQVLVEGGAEVAGRFHRAGLVDRYVVYFAPALLGGDDGRALMAGPGVPTMSDVWRGRIASVIRLGDDVRMDVVPPR
ncbi:MAG: bifunctional diaminohydroxyphosphoribosylaminopyrimidine deaminase/5-amino-6-(5-phosphoribosylamino)uracil reductase RibD [Actinomycetota bacterium]|nr:bifunctional diaminohydroxyphosphoribosylaminopyrimidine deaminase/5-amino-6-(5-phosphoribosylamino)uracil reductase RibD [Actinomycetota bacterium]